MARTDVRDYLFPGTVNAFRILRTFYGLPAGGLINIKRVTRKLEDHADPLGVMKS
jgi:hypothetical protein